MKCYYCMEKVKESYQHRHLMHKTEKGDTYHVCADPDCDWIYVLNEKMIHPLNDKEIYYCQLCREKIRK